MKVLLIFFGLIKVSDCAVWRDGYLDPIYLRENSEVTSTKVISAEIGQIQDFICPDDQEFSLYMVSYEAFQQCNIVHQQKIHNCNRPWTENTVCLLNNSV